MSDSFQDRINRMLRDAEAADVLLTATKKRVSDAALAELKRRGYDVEGKTPEEMEAIIKRPPTNPPKP